MEKCFKTVVNPEVEHIFAENSSLLMLNDECLIHVLNYLNVYDLVNVAKTCYRLQNVADICAYKYKKVRVVANKYTGITTEKLSNVLSVIGEHVSSVELDNANFFIFKTIRNNCSNLESIKLMDCKEPLQLQCFRNFKELKFDDARVTISELKNCFANNPNIENLEYECWYDNELISFIELLDMLPKLKSLRIYDLPISFVHHQQFQHLLHLDGLTKFSFQSLENCNQLLIELAKKLNLIEIDFTMDFNDHTFDLIKSFENLEYLSMSSYNWKKSWLSKTPLYPPKLKRLKLDCIKMSCKTFLLVVRQLEFLEEFYQDDGFIFQNLDECKSFY